jgi:hypothetical protein
MKQYFWFHPSYIAETSAKDVNGQKQNALKHQYIILEENELNRVSANDHLTLAGHSTPPKSTGEEDSDQGLHMQGETAEQLTARMIKAKLKVAPKVLSLECCKAGISNGLAYTLSTQSFFKNSFIETSTDSIGRNPGTISWTNMSEDGFGRVLRDERKHFWHFLLRGKEVAKLAHGQYDLKSVINTLSPSNFHDRFFFYYKPGIFGGRVGRYCASTKNKITLERAIIFANEDPNSATAQALDQVLEESSLAKLK